jgi:chorismate mutase/prephenate dehydratase
MTLDELRRKIDEADDRIIDALRARAEAADQIGRVKAEAGQDAFAPEREAEVLRRLESADATPLSTDALKAIFTEVISACRALERRLRIAYLGPEFTFSYQAVLARFGAVCDPVAFPSVNEAVSAVTTDQADLAIAPVENSTEGPVGETFDSLVETELQIVGEFYLAVQHALVGKTDLEDIAEVYSHPQPLAQCRRWLARHLPVARLVPTSSSADAAARAAAAERAAAIAPAEAGRANGLDVLASNIQDDPANRTRFWVVGSQQPAATGKDKTSLVMATPHRAGALHAALQPFRDFNINMTMIHSRPLKGRAWEYLFFIDFQGHADDPGPAEALAALGDLCPMLKVLGAYPAAD